MDKQLELCPLQTEFHPRVIGEGLGVYLIAPRVVAKPVRVLAEPVIYEEEMNPQISLGSLNSLNNEYNLMVKAKKLGLSVPEPYGIYHIALFPKKFLRFFRQPARKTTPALVMERIYGEHLVDIYDSSEKKHASSLLEKEIDKAKEHFILIDEEYPFNSIWSREQGRVYLIDLECWVDKSTLRA